MKIKMNSIGLNKIISSSAQQELDENDYLLEKLIDNKLQLHIYQKKSYNKIIKKHVKQM